MNTSTAATAPQRAAVPVLSTHDVVKSFGDVPALAGVTLDILPGETLAVMGPSGSGKSTLLHCLSGVLTPDAGQVAYRPTAASAPTASTAPAMISELSDAKRSHLRLTQFGFVFQDGQLLPELPARENVALPLMLTGTSTGKALRAADDVLGRLGMARLRDRRPAQMSGGQAQRVAVARALVASPRVVFADEPSGALDQATGHEMMQLLTTSVAMSGAALVLVTHDVDVARWCARLVEIRDGLVHADRRLDAEAGAHAGGAR